MRLSSDGDEQSVDCSPKRILSDLDLCHRYNSVVVDHTATRELFSWHRSHLLPIGKFSERIATIELDTSLVREKRRRRPNEHSTAGYNRW